MTVREFRHTPGAPDADVVARCAQAGPLALRQLSAIPLSQPHDHAPGRAPRVHYALPADAPRVTFADTAALHVAEGDGLAIAEGDWLEFVICPEAGRRERRASASVVVDLRFDDGGRLTDTRPLDHRGVPLDPRAQGAVLFVEEWNYVAVSLDGYAGRRVASVEIFVASDDSPVRGWVESVRIGARRLLAPLPIEGVPDPTPADHVDTRRGSRSSGEYSRGNCFPAVAVPHGFNFYTPVTDAGTLRWLYRYDSDIDETGRPALEAIAVSHLPSPWMADRGTFQFFPSAVGTGIPPMARASRRQTFDRATEEARPHRYAVTLDDGVRIAIAPTDHCAIVELTFPTEVGTVVFDNVDDRGDLTFEGASAYARSWVRGEHSASSPVMHVHVEFDREPVETVRRTVEGRRDVAGYARFRLGPDRLLRFRLATSFIDRNVARHAFAAEIAPNDTVASVSARARDLWNGILSLLDLSAATVDQRVALYSCLHRAFLYPNWQTETDPATGRRVHAAVDGSGEVREGALAVNHGFWDTYRTVWPLFALVRPATAGAFADGFLQHYRDDGWMPRWSAPGPANVMVGTNSDIVLADLAVKGVPGFDPALALRAAMRNAHVPPPRPEVGRRGLPAAHHLHFTPSAVHESVSWTVENCLNDFGIGVLATRVRAVDAGDDLAAYYFARAADYRRLFDPATGFLRAKAASGRFGRGGFGRGRFDPAEWGGGYTETNAWNALFAVPHDGEGLAALLGGPSGLESALDAFFATPETGSPALKGTYPHVIHEMREARDVGIGMLGLSNQPSHHIPFLYAHTPDPHKAHPIVRDAMRRLFVGSEIGQGYLGDEDNGELSAWLLLCAIGLYPLHVGTPVYVVTPPLLPRIAVALESGATLEVVRVGDEAGEYIVGASLNGVSLERTYLTHDEIAGGAVLTVEMGREPSDWGAESWRELPSLRGVGMLCDLTGQSTTRVRPWRARSLIDDVGHRSHPRTGTIEVTVTVTVPSGLAPRFVVVTAGDRVGAPVHWSLVALDPGGVERELVARRAAAFTHPFESMPFAIGPAAEVRAAVLRLEVVSGSSLSQVEILA